MGQLTSCVRQSKGCPQAVRIVHFTGQVEEFPWAVKVEQVLEEHPQHFVCSWRDLPAIATGHPVAAQDELSVGELYLVLPISTLDSNLSPKALAALAHRLLNAARKGASMSTWVRSRDSNRRFRSSECLINAKLMERCDNLELQKAYKEHLLSKARSWRPRLHTIHETCFAH